MDESFLQAPGAYPPAFLYLGGPLAFELSIFADESGDSAGKARYYLLTLVIHNQTEGILDKIQHYEASLVDAELPNIPFHSEPLLNGRDAYAHITLQQRKKLLYSFNVLVQRLPINYHTFIYRTSNYATPEKLGSRMERDIASFITNHLEFFQQFDDVKVYYDNGQDIVKSALDNAIECTLSKNAVIRRRTTMTEYRLAQVADYFCTIELAAAKYDAKENGATYDKFFGMIGSFKKNWLKQARRKRM